MEAKPEALYDCLRIVAELSSSARGASEEDIHLFSYLACLLFVYKAHPSSEWGYDFSATPTMAPFSPDLAAAADEAENLGWLEGEGLLRTISDAGQTELAYFGGLSRFTARDPYLVGACSTTLALPLPAVVGSVLTEPELRQALALSSTRPLLGDGGSSELYEHFDAISATVGLEQPDLMVPAVVWLTYLSENVLGSRDELAFNFAEGGC